MRYYGYHRVSTKEQHLDRGIKSIEEYCNSKKIELQDIFCDKSTGKNFNREEYRVLKRILKAGDIVIFSELDRLGRTKNGILKELEWFRDKKVRIMSLDIPTTLMDFESLKNDEMAKMILETINRMMIELYATFAQADMQRREKRQKEGIQSMKDRGEWDRYGRPHIVKDSEFKKEYERVLSGSITPTECMKLLGMKKSTYYVYRKKCIESNTLTE